jgi:uncharacterized protein (TIGR02996 family)
VTATPDPDVDALLSEIYRAPDDDGPRHVLADLLQQRGDPRGRFIALELHPDPTPAMRQEARALWLQHADQWLGPLASITSGALCETRRGFVSKLTMQIRRDRSTNMSELPEWALVEHVELPTDDPYMFFRRLRTVPRLTLPADAHLATIEVLDDCRCQELKVPGREPAALAELDLPAIKSLILTDTHRRLPTTAAWWPALRRLEVTAHTPGVIVQALSHPTAAVHFTYRVNSTDCVHGKRLAPLRMQLTCARPGVLSPGFVDSFIYMMLSQGMGWQIEAQLTDAQIRRLNDIGTGQWIALECA